MAFIPTIPTSTSSSFVSNTTVTTRLRNPALPATTKMALPDLSNPIRVVVGAAVISAACAFVITADADASVFKFSGKQPTDIGVQYGRYLQNCPETQNCISSSANAYDSHYVPSWTYNDESANKPKKSQQEAVDDLTKAIENYPRATIVKNELVSSEFGDGQYVYAHFESKLLGFVDDVEFYFRPDASTVEYRSASRLGESDLGANRKRIRELRKTLQDVDTRWASTGY